MGAKTIMIYLIIDAYRTACQAWQLHSMWLMRHMHLSREITTSRHMVAHLVPESSSCEAECEAASTPLQWHLVILKRPLRCVA